MDNASSYYSAHIGARLLNLGLGVFECFCCIVILLSAVRIGILLTLACGIGMSITLRVLRTLTSVLDYLYGI